jgi:hypothetical protein
LLLQARFEEQLLCLPIFKQFSSKLRMAGDIFKTGCKGSYGTPTDEMIIRAV